MDIQLKDHLEKKIKKYVKEGKYDSVNAFLNAAAETLLMAEERASMFSPTANK